MDLNNLLYTVENIMNKEFLTVKKTEKLRAVINRIVSNNIDEVLILKDSGHVDGIFTRSDIAKIDDIETFKDDKIEKHMIKDIITIDYKISLILARDLMIKNNIGRVPVIKDGKIIGILTSNNLRDSFYLDIHKMLELQMNILDNIHEAICISDKDGQVLYFNKSAEKLYNINAGEVINKPIETHFNNPIILKVLKEKVAIENVKHEPIDGKFVILSAVPIFDVNNELVAVVSTDRDVTEVEALSKKLESANEKVEMLSKAYSREFANNYKFLNIVGKSKKLMDAINLSQKVASTSASVLIIGESGTGKEVFAKEIHESSGRKGPFIAVNCSAIPENLLESELFGYVEGAFTGAIKKGKKGMFEFADNGTLFLDEIGDMPIGMQSKLLRVLQDGVIYRLGSEKPIQTNTRIIAATNKNLREAIKNKEFREDLFYRLAVVQVELPPLREREGDVRELIDYFIKEVSKKENIDITKIEDDAYDILCDYKWEGNVRELKNIIQRMVILSIDGVITKKNIPKYILDLVDEDEIALDKEFIDELDLEKQIDNLEYKLIKKAMEKASGNKAKAADILNIKRTTLYYKLKHYGFLDSMCQ